MYVSNVLQEPLPVIVSCVEEIGPPFRVHPHKLLGNDCSDDGVCRVKLLPENNMTHEFNHLKLQCVRKDDIIHELAKRQHSNVDPFNQGFEHASKMERRRQTHTSFQMKKQRMEECNCNTAVCLSDTQHHLRHAMHANPQ